MRSHELTNTTNEFSPKQNGPAHLSLVGFKSDIDFIQDIIVRIKYDLANTDHSSFYGTDQIVQTFTQSYTGSQNNYDFDWDGRDNRNNRILLGGNYTVTVDLTTNLKKTTTISSVIVIDEPRMISFGINYDLRNATQREIDMYRDYDRRGLLVWNAVPELNRFRNNNFEWLGNFGLAIDLGGDIPGYLARTVSGQRRSEDILDELKNNGAVFRFMGHHTLFNNSGQTIGDILFQGERLLADCLADAIICGQEWTDGDGTIHRDLDNTHCMNIDCEGNPRDSRYLDDILFASLLGCRTGIGTYSTAQAFIEQGVDCVLATNLRVPVSFIAFYNMSLMEQLQIESLTIREACRNAYEDAIDKMIRYFVGIDNIDDLINAFTDDRTGERYLDSYDNTILILNESSSNPVSEQHFLPARYGRKN